MTAVIGRPSSGGRALRGCLLVSRPRAGARARGGRREGEERATALLGTAVPASPGAETERIPGRPDQAVDADAPAPARA
ncbi:hypothetical protein STTU_1365 [Streptomyces sp. Tu6071]|nr:hypothetical protein STTU_1365 [Streptomyces sp. Tu6071]